LCVKQKELNLIVNFLEIYFSVFLSLKNNGNLYEEEKFMSLKKHNEILDTSTGETGKNIKNELKATAKRKPRKCPRCGNSTVASILYGLPKFSAKLKTDLFFGHIVLGGCCITDCDPSWQCIECELQIYNEHDFFIEDSSE